MTIWDRVKAFFGARSQPQIEAGGTGRPTRDTFIYPRLTPYGAPARKGQAIWKPTPLNIRYFSRSPYCRRAIQAIQTPISSLEWDVSPRKDVAPLGNQKARIAALKNSLHNPNELDSWHSMIEAVIEDICLGAGAIEIQTSPIPERPLWLWPVDGLSIQIYAQWSGLPNEARYLQIPGMTGGTGYSMGGIHLRNDELIYLKPSPNTASPFGLGAVEVAFMTISRLLGAETYAGNVASNASPNFFLWFQHLSDDELQAVRDYWQNEVEGRGIVPIFTSDEKPPEAVSMHERRDEGLYLKWQEFLIRELAAAFSLSPGTLGLERDVNRSTAEVGEDRDWEQAIKPMAHKIMRALNRHAIWERLHWTDIEFKFVGLDREDELLKARIYERNYRNNATTPNEYRERMGLPPLANKYSDLTYTEAQMAIAAVKGSTKDDNPTPTDSKEE